MSLIKDIEINTETTGFASPAETYVDKRLDLNDLMVNDIYSTFYFRYSGEKKFDISNGDILLIDRSSTYEYGDLVVVNGRSGFKIMMFDGDGDIFGKVNWVISKR